MIAAACARQHGVIGRAQARAAGLAWRQEQRRLAAGRLFEPLDGVLSLTPSLSDLGLLMAAALHGHGVVGGWSRLHLAEVVRGRPVRPYVITDRRDLERPALDLHHTRGLPAADLEAHAGIPVTTVGRALLDVARVAHPEALRAAVHEAQFLGHVDPLGLAAIVSAHPGHPGCRALRAIEPAPARSANAFEAHLSRLLAPLGAHERQHRLAGLSGRVHRADIAYLDARLLVEADGRAAHARMLAFETDRERDADLAGVGWLTLRVTARQVDDAPARVIRTVAAALAARRTPPRGRPRRRRPRSPGSAGGRSG